MVEGGRRWWEMVGGGGRWWEVVGDGRWWWKTVGNVWRWQDMEGEGRIGWDLVADGRRCWKQTFRKPADPQIILEAKMVWLKTKFWQIYEIEPFLCLKCLKIWKAANILVKLNSFNKSSMKELLWNIPKTHLFCLDWGQFLKTSHLEAKIVFRKGIVERW